MPCPIASTVGAVGALGGVHSLLTRDRRYRVLSWLVLLGLLAGWTAYYLTGRSLPVRVALEVLSVAALVAAVLRVRRLVRDHGVTPPMWGGLARAMRAASPVLGWSPVLGAKVWWLSMLVAEWRDMAHWPAWEHGLVLGAIVALAAWRVVQLRRAPRFGALESYATTAGATAACPLGFGCERAARSAAFDADRAPDAERFAGGAR